MILSAIAAMSLNRVIGKNNSLPWNEPEDMQFFREKTKGKILIFGRKTFQSLGRPLPNRFHIVVTRSANFEANDPKVETVNTFPQAVELARMLLKKNLQEYHEEVMVSGGKEIYRLALPVISRLYLTLIQREVEGDSFFPDFDIGQFELKEQRQSKGLIFLRYDRK